MPDGNARHPLVEEIEEHLTKEGATEVNLHAVLDKTLAHFGGAVGTIHSLLPQSGVLNLRAYRGIPDALLARVRTIPVGKGMAGLAAERREPVQVCNLQTAPSGVAKPAAKETQMEGSIAVPMLIEDSLGGVLGIAKPVAHEFTDAEKTLLLHIGTTIAKFLGPS
jgi:L-methionine (R)-S-oxide reductase